MSSALYICPTLPPKKSQKYRVSLQYWSDPLKITKLLNQHSMLGQHLHASETPFQWRADGGPFIAVFGFLYPHQLKKKKTLSNLDPL